jgi:hypothetical protein
LEIGGKFSKLRRETTLASLLIAVLLGCTLITYSTTAYTPQNVNAQKAGVGGHDFNEHYWNVTADFLDFLRAKYPSAHIPSNMSLNVYTVWVNESSIPLQMLYLGFKNFSYGSLFNMTMPMQIILEHYKTPNGTHVLLASSFMMMMAHNDSSGPNIPNVPDKNDTAVWVSLSVGADAILKYLAGIGASINPNMNVSAEPLQMNVSTNHYEWGMRYKNLASLWFHLDMGNTSKGYNPLLLQAISILSELTFIYNMTINPPTATSGGNATIRMSYRIGEFTDLWIDAFPLYIDYYNGTVSQRLWKFPIGVPPNPDFHNVTDFLTQGDFKLSLAFYQKAALVNATATYKDDQNNTASDTDMNVTIRRVGAYLGGSKILETGLGTSKIPYQLYNTSGVQTYDSVAYTRKFHGLRDHDLFAGLSTILSGVLKLVALDMEPHLPTSVSIDFASSDYIFTVTYPMWGGYRIVHDPYFAVYTAPTGTTGGGISPLLIIGAAGAVVVIAAAVLLLRRRK